MHKGLQTLVRDLNAAYRAVPALHQLDCEPEGFEWLVGNDSDQSVLAYLRRGRDQPERIAVAACNFTPVPRHGYRFGVPHPGWYAERVNTDAALYGGANIGNGGGVHAEPVPWGGHPYSFCLTLPPLATLVLERHAG